MSGRIQIRIVSVLIQNRIWICNTGFNQFYCCRIEPATVEYVDEGLPGTEVVLDSLFFGVKYHIISPPPACLG